MWVLERVDSAERNATLVGLSGDRLDRTLMNTKSREPHAKGTSLLPLVVALKALPNREEIVPKKLWKYFDTPIMVSGWYPERDFFVLIEAFVGTMDPALVGDPWVFIGVTSAQRDIGGSQESLPEELRVSEGLYKRFAGEADVEVFMKRGAKLWEQYHDTGKIELLGGRTTTNSVVVRLRGFAIPVEGYLRLNIAYTEEYGRLVGIDIKGKILRSTARGDPFCEWEYTLGRTPASEAFIASLPPLPER